MEQGQNKKVSESHHTSVLFSPSLLTESPSSDTPSQPHRPGAVLSTVQEQSNRFREGISHALLDKSQISDVDRSKKRLRAWRFSSALLNLLAVCLLVGKAIGNLIGIYAIESTTYLKLDDDMSFDLLAWHYSVPHKAICDRPEYSPPECGGGTLIVDFETDPLCSDDAVSSSRHFEGRAYTVEMSLQAISGSAGLLMILIYPILKCALQQSNVWPPFNRLGKVYLEVVGLMLLLGMMSPILNFNPCPSYEWRCSLNDINDTYDYAYCTIDTWELIESHIWIVTTTIVGFVLIMIAFTEVPYIKKHFSHKLGGGFTDTNIRKNRSLQGCLIVLSVLASIDLAIIWQNFNMMKLLSLCAVSCFALDSFIQVLTTSKPCQSMRYRHWKFWLSHHDDTPDESSSVIAEQCRVISRQEKSTVHHVLPQRLVSMMADETKVSRMLYDDLLRPLGDCNQYFSIELDVDLIDKAASFAISDPLNSGSPIKGIPVGPVDYTKYFRIGPNAYLLEQTNEDSTSASPMRLSAFQGSEVNFPAQEKCAVCCTKFRSMLMEPCLHLVYCTECFHMSLNIKRTEVEKERHGIMMRIHQRHQFIRSCFRKMHHSSIMTEQDLKALNGGELSLPQPNIHAFIVTCPLCRHRVERVLHLNLTSYAKERYQGSIVNDIDYSRLHAIVTAFEAQEARSRYLMDAFLQDVTIESSPEPAARIDLSYLQSEEHERTFASDSQANLIHLTGEWPQTTGAAVRTTTSDHMEEMETKNRLEAMNRTLRDQTSPTTLLVHGPCSSTSSTDDDAINDDTAGVAATSDRW